MYASMFNMINFVSSAALFYKYGQLHSVPNNIAFSFVLLVYLYVLF
jgi:hypothetical protein